MSSSPSVPAAPNYDAVAQASQTAANNQYAIAQQQLQFAKDQYADIKPYTTRVASDLADTMDQSNANAQKDRARYEQIYQPLEDQAVQDAKTYDSPEREAQNRGLATGAVSQNYDQAGDAAARQLESFGVDPSSTRFAALDVGVRTAKAAATAAAGTTSDLNTQATARAMRDQAINTGKGYPSQISQSYGTGTAAGSAGNSAQTSTFSAFAPSLANPTAWQGLGNQSIGTWGSTLNNQGAYNMAGYNAQMNSSSGVGSALGLIGGTLLNKFLARGGPVTAGPGGSSGVPVAGKQVPPSMSPSGGAQTDDVPAKVNGVGGSSGRPTAAINVGEFVMPKRTTSFYGTKFMEDLIKKSDAKMGLGPQKIGATSRPVNKPVRSALPV